MFFSLAILPACAGFANEYRPRRIEGLSNIVSVFTCMNISMALDSDGHVWTWGGNSDSARGHFGNRNYPHKIEGLSNVAAISAGWGFSLALDNYGRMWTWWGLSGQVDRSRVIPRLIEVEGLNKVIAISAGDDHRMALDEYGNVWVWGSNRQGQLGLDSASILHMNLPHKVAGLPNIVAINAKGHTSMALDSYGRVWTWGCSFWYYTCRVCNNCFDCWYCNGCHS